MAIEKRRQKEWNRRSGEGVHVNWICDWTWGEIKGVYWVVMGELNWGMEM